ncbi:MAG: YbbR-like domain-containing protein [Myxococcales bacterium]|nr:YbbR-like domain-containing protein [Myxococcales bacterium]
MREVIRHWFLHDALLKGMSLVIAVVLFVIVRGDRDAASGAYVKVIYALPKDRVLISDPAVELRIAVRGPWTRVSRFDEQDLDPVRIDLSKVASGDLRFTEEMIKLPVGLRLGSITPPSVKLAFEPRVERMVPVQPMLEGEPASGYRVVRSVAHPREVRVSGAKSVVEGIQRVPTRPLRIADAREPVRGPVQLESPPPHASFEGVGEVSIEVEVVAALAERTLRAVPVRVTGGLRMEAHLEPEAADVVLRGPADVLARVAPGVPSLLVDAQAEDSRPAGAFRKRIGVVGLPTDVAAEVRPESVTLVTKRRRD